MIPLFLRRLNLMSPYVVWEQGGNYSFSSDYGITFSVSFEEADTYEVHEAFWFSLMTRSHTPSPSDPKVQQTIVCIIEEFFRVNSSVLLYMCDTADSQQAARSRLFLRWFHEADKQERYLIKTAMIKDGSQENYIALIIQRSHPDYDAIVQFFDEEVALFKANKPGNPESDMTEHP